MSISTKEAFELGFLQRCADEGLTPEQTQLRIKAAEMFVEKQATIPTLNHGPFIPPGAAATAAAAAIPPTILEQMLSYAKKHPFMASGGATAGLGALGFGAGAGARMLQGDFVDPEDVKKQEIINEYRNLAHTARLPQVSQGL